MGDEPVRTAPAMEFAEGEQFGASSPFIGEANSAGSGTLHAFGTGVVRAQMLYISSRICS